MSLRQRLFLSLFMIATLSVVTATYFAVNSINRRFLKIAQEEVEGAARMTESLFYDSLGEINRKAIFTSELEELMKAMGDPRQLDLVLSFKSIFFGEAVVRILDERMNPIALRENGPAALPWSSLKGLSPFDPTKDPLQRESGIFSAGGQIVMISRIPVLDPDSFNLRGHIVFERVVDDLFVDTLKEKTQSELFVFNPAGASVASTMESGDGRRMRPDGRGLTTLFHAKELELKGENFIVRSLTVRDPSDRIVGTIAVAVNLQERLVAQRVSIKNIILTSLLVLLAVFLVSIVWGQNLVRPIKILRDGTERIAQGDYSVRVKIDSKDEIGELATFFNGMVESLTHQRESLTNLKRFFESILSQSPSIILSADEEGRIISLNTAAELLLGITEREAVGNKLFELFPILQELKEEYFTVLLSGSPLFLESFSYTGREHVEKTLRMVLFKVPREKGAMVVIQGEDITEKIEMKARLFHAERLGALGEFLGRFTHEFKNLMLGFSGQLELLKREVPKDSPSQHRLSSLENVLTRSQRLGESILDFTRKDRLQKAPVELSEAVESVLGLMGKTLLQNIELERHYYPGGLKVLANREKILLALFNVLLNGRDAIASSGREKGLFRITLDRILWPGTEKFWVRLSLWDNGPGISSEHLQKIFEPYFTTKGDKGNGLGLATVKEIVEEYEGQIQVESEVGVGTSFIFLFPELENVKPTV